MQTKQSKSRIMQSILLAGIAYVFYNVILFVIAKFDDHGAPFWMSYAFINVAFFSLVINAFLLKSRNVTLSDFIFGFPILKNCFIYLGVEFFLSTLFMLLDAADISWVLTFVVQFLALGFHLVLVISSYIAHDTIKDVQTKVKDASNYIRLLQVDVEMVAQKCVHPEAKAAFARLAEDVRYSDPMSNACLFELEKEINLTIANADFAVNQRDYSSALVLCNRAKMLLMERNQKCKALK